MSRNISYISTNIVRPASPTETPRRIDLTPWDLLNLPCRYIQRGILFLKPEEETNLISHLITSFARTLDYFVPLTARLATETHQDDTISFYTDCQVVGAQFIHAAADVTVADLLDPVSVVESFFPLNGVINYEGQTQPLLAVQVTELVDGIFIAFSMNRAIADGKGLWHFVNCWSTISRSSDHIPTLPLFKRWFLNETDCPIRLPSSIEERMPILQRFSPPTLCVKVFHFTPQKLAEIKLEANKDRETNEISTLQALLGHIWITATRARSLEADQMVIYYIAGDCRMRLNPPLPQEYFGNAVQGVAAIAKAGELLERGLGWAASLLNQAVKSLDDEKIRMNWNNWMKEPLLAYPHTMTNPNVIATGGSPRFNVYGNDFGWGRPIATRTGPAQKTFEVVIVNPGATEGSLDVEICLAPQIMKAIEDYAEFTEVVAI